MYNMEYPVKMAHTKDRKLRLSQIKLSKPTFRLYSLLNTCKYSLGLKNYVQVIESALEAFVIQKGLKVTNRESYD